MSGISFGDMAQQFNVLRNGGSIKTDLARLSGSLSTGKVADLTQELGGGTERFSGIKYSLKQIDAYQKIASETAQLLANTQSVLSGVDAIRSTASERLLLVNEGSTRAQIDEAATSSRSAFGDMVRLINTQIGDRALLGGARVDGAPLADPEDMLGSLILAIGGATNTAAITAITNAWFDDAGGGFETLGYLGGTGSVLQRQISETSSVALEARADDPAIRAVLKSSALAALASELPALDQATQTELLELSGQDMFRASSDIVAVQARIGFTEMTVANTIAQQKSQETALGLLSNDMSRADPFETASALQAVQLQLETHFTVTARLSQLSLLRYL